MGKKKFLVTETSFKIPPTDGLTRLEPSPQKQLLQSSPAEGDELFPSLRDRVGVRCFFFFIISSNVCSDVA